MRSLTHTLITLALVVISHAAVEAQSYKYSNIRKDYVYDDGFGIAHSKTVARSGEIKIAPNEVNIDGAVYRRNEKGVYKNEKGKSVDLSFGYCGRKISAVRISTGYIVNNYLFDDVTPAVADANSSSVATGNTQQ